VAPSNIPYSDTPSRRFDLVTSRLLRYDSYVSIHHGGRFEGSGLTAVAEAPVGVVFRTKKSPEQGPERRTPDGATSREARAKIATLVRCLAIEMVPPRSLVSNRRNPRRHSDRQILQIAASVQTFGFVTPLLVDESSTVIAGYGRLATALRIGMNEVPVVRVDHLTTEQKRAYMLADNRLAELSDWDPELIKIELAELSDLDLDFDLEVSQDDKYGEGRAIAIMYQGH
jgi:hypothetical protein